MIATSRSAPRELVSLQYLRGFAAMLVVMHHAFIQIDWINDLFADVHFGEAGVDIFFVISGFIMFHISYDSDAGVKRFLFRRVARVVPLYWIFTTLIFVLALAAPSLFRSVIPEVQHYVLSLLFIPHANPNPDLLDWPILVPGWTLEYEMFFYVIFAAFIGLRQNRNALLIALVFAAIVAVGATLNPSSPVLATYTNSLLLEFVYGVGIGYLFRRGVLSKLPAVAVLLVVGLALLPLSAAYQLSLPRAVYYGIPAAMIVIGALALEPILAPRKLRLFERLGDASYSIYLSHLFTLGAVRKAWSLINLMPGTMAGALVYMAAALVLCAMAGIAVWYALERPLMRGAKRVEQRIWPSPARLDPSRIVGSTSA